MPKARLPSKIVINLPEPDAQETDRRIIRVALLLRLPNFQKDWLPLKEKLKQSAIYLGDDTLRRKWKVDFHCEMQEPDGVKITLLSLIPPVPVGVLGPNTHLSDSRDLLWLDRNGSLDEAKLQFERICKERGMKTRTKRRTYADWLTILESYIKAGKKTSYALAKDRVGIRGAVRQGSKSADKHNAAQALISKHFADLEAFLNP